MLLRLRLLARRIGDRIHHAFTVVALWNAHAGGAGLHREAATGRDRGCFPLRSRTSIGTSMQALPMQPRGPSPCCLPANGESSIQPLKSAHPLFFNSSLTMNVLGSLTTRAGAVAGRGGGGRVPACADFLEPRGACPACACCPEPCAGPGRVPVRAASLPSRRDGWAPGWLEFCHRADRSGPSPPAQRGPRAPFPFRQERNGALYPCFDAVS